MIYDVSQCEQAAQLSRCCCVTVMLSQLQPACLPACLSASTKAPAGVLGDLLLLSPDPLEPPHAAKAILHYER